MYITLNTIISNRAKVVDFHCQFCATDFSYWHNLVLVCPSCGIAGHHWIYAY